MRPKLCHNSHMDDIVHFEGDPATDSARRRMERVLKAQEPASRWAWIAAALGGSGVWLLWHWGRAAARRGDAPANEAKSDRH
jgi:hypothetical protein